MTRNDEPSRADVAQPALPGLAPGHLSLPGHDAAIAHAQSTTLARRTKFAASRHRPWWKWLLIGLLLLFSLTITILYAIALTADLSRHHWADALDASRDAVPAVVGWAALVIVFFTRGTAVAERMLSVDSYALGEKEKQAAKDQDSVASADRRVQQLTAKLEQLTAARDRVSPAAELGPGRECAGPDLIAGELDREVPEPDRDAGELDREVAETTARLEQARQWLTGARAALAASQLQVAEAEEKLANDFPESAEQPDPGAGKTA